MPKSSDKAMLQKSTAEAIKWHIQSHGSSFGPKDQRDMQDWTEHSAQNRQSLREVEAFTSSMDRLNHRQLQQLIALKHHRNLSSRWPTGLAMVAAVCGLILGAWYLSDALHWGADYASRTGETRAVSLTDGSTVELNTNSAIKIALTPEKRQITLLAGEAFFAVAPDPQRPFQVIVGQGTIQALGTAFNVRVDAHQTTISVSEHSVQVTSAGQSNSRELSQGNRVRMGDDGKISAVEPYNEQRDLAWRRHRLIFEHQPLTEVLAEMSRYRQGFIIPMDNKLSEETITGVFDTTRIDEALNTIESGLHVKLIRITDRLVLLFSPP